ncbi:MAG: hypothetical protein K0U29_03675 [Gammaproteobacteria bacterium]|nr:hypothetical protein [Gammaproteobacteria bacterium]MCH9744012.1 hypothetical protein [Gammaproteobacteria bacterium]
MAKHAFLLVVATVLGVFFRNELAHVLDWLLYLHNQLANWLAIVFSSDSLGRVLQGVLALLLVPVSIGGMVTTGHWMIKRSGYEHTMILIWMIWLILLVTMLVQMSFTGGIGAQRATHIAAVSSPG